MKEKKAKTNDFFIEMQERKKEFINKKENKFEKTMSIEDLETKRTNMQKKLSALKKNEHYLEYKEIKNYFEKNKNYNKIIGITMYNALNDLDEIITDRIKYYNKTLLILNELDFIYWSIRPVSIKFLGLPTNNLVIPDYELILIIKEKIPNQIDYKKCWNSVNPDVDTMITEYPLSINIENFFISNAEFNEITCYLNDSDLTFWNYMQIIHKSF